MAGMVCEVKVRVRIAETDKAPPRRGERRVTRRSRDERDGLIKAYLISGMSPANFCREKNIPLRTFYRWLRACAPQPLLDARIFFEIDMEKLAAYAARTR